MRKIKQEHEMEVREHANSTEWLLKLLNIHSIGHGDIGCIKKKIV